MSEHMMSMLSRIIFTISLVISTCVLHGCWHEPGRGFFDPGYMHGWGMGGYSMVFMVLFWVVLIAGVVLLVRYLMTSTRGVSGTAKDERSNALDILKERYARGEIDKEEFEEKKKDILS